MADIKDVEAQFTNAGIPTVYSEQWNGTYVYVKATKLGFEQTESAILHVFRDCELEHEDDDFYQEQHSTIYAFGPRATKKHRWQVSILSSKDEDAIDDLGSYLNIELERHAKDDDKYLVVLFDNDSRYTTD